MDWTTQAARPLVLGCRCVAGRSGLTWVHVHVCDLTGFNIPSRLEVVGWALGDSETSTTRECWTGTALSIRIRRTDLVIAFT